MSPSIKTMNPASGLMITTGLLLLLGWAAGWDMSFGHSLWQLFIIVPGIIVISLGCTEKTIGKALVPFGMMITVTGCLLAYQDWADHYQSWAYVWILSGPFAFAKGLALYGVIHSDIAALRNGRKMMLASSTLFVIFAAVFELVLNISGFGITVDVPWGLVLPIILIGSGIFVGYRFK